jgi:hypothetical protein
VATGAIQLGGTLDVAGLHVTAGVRLIEWLGIALVPLLYAYLFALGFHELQLQRTVRELYAQLEPTGESAASLRLGPLAHPNILDVSLRVELLRLAPGGTVLYWVFALPALLILLIGPIVVQLIILCRLWTSESHHLVLGPLGILTLLIMLVYFVATSRESFSAA